MILFYPYIQIMCMHKCVCVCVCMFYYRNMQINAVLSSSCFNFLWLIIISRVQARFKRWEKLILSKRRALQRAQRESAPQLNENLRGLKSKTVGYQGESWKDIGSQPFNDILINVVNSVHLKSAGDSLFQVCLWAFLGLNEKYLCSLYITIMNVDFWGNFLSTSN